MKGREFDLIDLRCRRNTFHESCSFAWFVHSSSICQRCSVCRASSLLLSSKCILGVETNVKRPQSGGGKEALNPQSSVCVETQASIQQRLMWAFSSLNWRKLSWRVFITISLPLFPPDSMFCLSCRGGIRAQRGSFILQKTVTLKDIPLNSSSSDWQTRPRLPPSNHAQ